ncbi:MAG: hypothetical protein ACOYBD_07995 [Bilifractor sp.]
MKNVCISLTDGSYDGPIVMTSGSKVSVVRAKKGEVSDYCNELEGAGIYFLLIGTDEVYVGESGLSTVGSRIMNTHSGQIDSLWHTVVGFVVDDKTLGNNELLYMENAMCEYAHNHFSKCLTTTPAQKNCNASFRKSHYKLGAIQISTCDQYLADMIDYIDLFPNGVFPAGSAVTPGSAAAAAPASPADTATFYFRNPKRDVDGTAEIMIHTGDTKKRKAVLKSGSRISTDVSDHFSSADRVKAYRDKLISEGKIIDRVLQEDVLFDSQSGAGEFLNGMAFDGNGSWKRIGDNVPLKMLLK